MKKNIAAIAIKITLFTLVGILGFDLGIKLRPYANNISCNVQIAQTQAPYKTKETLPTDVGQWKSTKLGQPSKMTFENLTFENFKTQPNTTYIRMTNKAEPEPNIYMTVGFLVKGLKPNAAHKITVSVLNETIDYMLFVTTDPIWDQRTPCVSGDAEEHQYTHPCESNRNGEIAVRLVSEKPGVALIRNVVVEAVQ